MDIGSLTGQVALEDQLTDKLTLMAEHVKHFADEFDGMAGTVLIGAGVITAAVTGAVISIVAMGEKGSVLLGVEQAFDRLAASAGTTGEALRSGLSEGVRHTVDEMTLMESTSKLLSSGMKISESQMTLMGQAAREMGKATGGDAASGLSTLSTALTTGNTRLLKRAGIQVDLKKAEQDYAAALHTTADHLTPLGKLEADRIGILQGTQTWLNRIGVSELSFKERIQQSEVAIEEWTAKLEKTVAASPHVMAAYDAMSAAILKAFGGSSQTLMDWIVKWVNRFADAVTHWGPIIIQTMSDIVHKVQEIYNEIIHAWDTAPEWFRNISRDALLAGIAVGGVTVATKTFTGSDVLSNLANIAQIWSVVGGAAAAAVVQIKGVYQALTVFYLLGSFAGGGVTGGVAGILTGIGTAIMGIVSTPLFAVAAAITAIYAAYKAGQMHEVQDWFEKMELYAEGMSMAEAKAAVATHRLTDATIASAAADKLAQKAADDYWNAPNPRLAVTSPSGGGAANGPLTKLDTSAYDSFIKQIEHLSSTLDSAAAHHMPLTQQVKLYGDAAAKATEEAAGWGVKVTSSIQKIANAANDKAFKEFQDKLTVKPLTSLPGTVIDTGIQDYIKNLEMTTAADKAAAAQRHALAQTGYDFEISLAQKVMNANEASTSQKLSATRHYYALLHQQAADNYEFERKNIIDGTAQQVSAINKLGYGWELLEAATKAAGQAALDALNAKYGKTELETSLARARAEAELLYKKAMELGNQFLKVGGAISDLGQTWGGVVGGMISGIGGVVNAWGQAIQAIAAYKKQGGASGADKASAILGGVSNVVGATGTGSTTQRAIGGALAGAEAGLAIGAAFAPATLGLSLAIGAAAGALAGFLRGVVGLTAYQKAMRQAAIDTATLRASLLTTHGGMVNLVADADLVGINMKEAFTWKDPEALKKIIEELDAKTQALASDMQTYGFSWQDMGTKAQIGGTRAGDALVDSYKRMTLAGIPAEKVLTSMGGALSQYIIDSIHAGTTIPAAMRPIIESLIQQGTLTDAAAKAMLGMAESSLPSLTDITAAADRYGISLDSLGPKVKQLQITELATQYVADWKTLTAATDDWGVLFDKMGPKVQDLVTDAMKYGLELPSSMKPMIEAFIKAGHLTDDTGAKLEDLSKLTFAADLSAMFEGLMTKLDELIDKISTGVGGALDGLGNRVITPHIKPQYDEATPSDKASARVLPFPTPGDTVAPRSKQPVDNQVTIMVGNDVIARQLVKSFVNGGL